MPDLPTALGEPALTTRGILERWDEMLPRLHERAADETADWRPLEHLRAHAPVEPRQVFQPGVFDMGAGDPVGALRAAGLPDDDFHAVRGGNATTLLRLT